MNVSFTTDEKENVEFNQDGDVTAHYDIVNFQRMSDGSFAYVKIGDFYLYFLISTEAKKLNYTTFSPHNKKVIGTIIVYSFRMNSSRPVMEKMDRNFRQFAPRHAVLAFIR